MFAVALIPTKPIPNCVTSQSWLCDHCGWWSLVFPIAGAILIWPAAAALFGFLAPFVGLVAILLDCIFASRLTAELVGRQFKNQVSKVDNPNELAALLARQTRARWILLILEFTLIAATGPSWLIVLQITGLQR